VKGEPFRVYQASHCQFLCLGNAKSCKGFRDKASRFGHATHLIRGLGGSHDAKEITKLLGLAGCLGKTESKKAKTDQELE